MKPKYPIYIPSKGRWASRLTIKALEEMGVPFLVVVEDQEFDNYAAVISEKKILVLDKDYQKKYDTCDKLGLTKSVGPGAARNFSWDHAIKRGFKWHWVIDDNINRFFRYNKNLKVPATTGAIFLAMEDFCERYENVAMAGPNYFMFVSRKSKMPPFVANTRIYSCNLIRNDIPYRWRGRYNEDTDLSLRMLKDGYCTVLFNTFLQEKITTQKIPGGNTAEFYANEGTLPKSQMQVAMHPDISRVVFRFGRWHHVVDYSRFRANKLMLKPDTVIPDNNEYGMMLIED